MRIDDYIQEKVKQMTSIVQELGKNPNKPTEKILCERYHYYLGCIDGARWVVAHGIELNEEGGSMRDYDIVKNGTTYTMRVCLCKRRQNEIYIRTRGTNTERKDR